MSQCGAGQISGIAGGQGTNALVRPSAFILLCIGIEIVWNAL